MMTKRFTASRYTEEQSTVWLAWLAHNMQGRAQTIFQIEDMQPDWLVSNREEVLHRLLTRLTWGILCGLSIGLAGGLSIGIIDGLNKGIINGIINGLIGGLVFGLICGVIEIFTPIHKVDANLRAEDTSLGDFNIRMMILFGLSMCIIFGLIYGLQYGVIIGLIGGIAYGLILGQIFLLVTELIGKWVQTSGVTFRDADRHLRKVESLLWSWELARLNSLIGLKFGLLGGSGIGLIYGLQIGLRDGLFGGLSAGLFGGLSVGLLGGLLGGLAGGFQPGPNELKTLPNQGIRLTIQSALKISLPIGFVLGLILWWLSESLHTGLVAGMTISAVTGLWNGGLSVIEHGIIRLIIWWRGHAPLNYAKFLDYAAEELNFLQKVGGGYVFIHRYLLEHFAEIAVEEGYVERTTANSDRN